MKQSKVQRAAYLLSQLREKRERASGIIVPDLLFEKRLSVDQGLICHLRSFRNKPREISQEFESNLVSASCPSRISCIDEKGHEFPTFVVFTEKGKTPVYGKKRTQISDDDIPLSTLSNLVDIWRGFEEHHRNDLERNSITIYEQDGKMRTRKDIFVIRSSGRLNASASAACRYRSWAKLHISLARCTSQPSEIAICRPRMERRVTLVDFSLAVGMGLIVELRSSSVSKSLLLLFDGLS